MAAVVVALAGCGTPQQPPAAGQSGEAAAEKDWTDHTQGLPFLVGYDEGLRQAQSQNKPAMLFITTTWCGWCKRLAKESFNDPGVKDLLSKFICVIVDGDVEVEPQKKFGTQGYPHLVFVSPTGQKVGECMGYVKPDEFKALVLKALAAAKDT